MIVPPTTPKDQRQPRRTNPGSRFRALYDKVYRRDVLEHAWELVRANKGAAGIDRQTIADVDQYGIDRLLDELPRI
jgi:RNA-directed DNA polymerase